MNEGLIHPSAVIDDGAKIGAGTRIWHFSHVMNNSIVGENCMLGQNVLIGSEVILGNNVRVQNNVSLYTGVVCEDDVFIGPSAVFTNVINPRSAVPRKDQFRKTYVHRGASIGANATIICGISIGEFAFIGAGAVVTKDVAPYALVVGNPARQTAWVSEYGHKLNFSEEGKGICPETNQIYRLSNGRVQPYNENPDSQEDKLIEE